MTKTDLVTDATQLVTTTARVETSSDVLAAQSEALVRARYAVALQRPRDIDDVRTRLLSACRRTSFATEAIYRKPIGRGVEGLSVRFAEELARSYGNLQIGKQVLFDDLTRRIVRISVTDLETSLTYDDDISITKTVERSSVKDGRIPSASRTNSDGRTVYTVPATEDEMLAKEQALTSKSLRNLLLRLLPADIKEECWAELVATRRSDVEHDPDAARKKIVDAFGGIGVAYEPWIAH